VSDVRSDRGAALQARLRSDGERLRAARAGCPSPDLLVARSTGALEPAFQSSVDAHLGSCDACRRLAADIDALHLAAAEPAVEQRVRTRVFVRPSRRRWLLPLVAAAVLMSVVAVGWRVWPGAAPAAPDVAREATVSPEARPAAGSTPVVALWEVAPALVRVPLSSLGPTRGGESATEGAGLIDALGPYQGGDYARAIERLSEWVRVSPKSGEGHFYLGVSQLLTGDPRGAEASLSKAHELLPASRRREVDWYRAAAEQRSGGVSAARARLRALCAEAGAYRTEACEAGSVLR
jgi:hypothetical protein